jgi:hypothetical protein
MNLRTVGEDGKTVGMLQMKSVSRETIKQDRCTMAVVLESKEEPPIETFVNRYHPELAALDQGSGLGMFCLASVVEHDPQRPTKFNACADLLDYLPVSSVWIGTVVSSESAVPGT